MDEIEILHRKLAREKLARKEAESILEKKSAELYQANTVLKTLAEELSEKEKYSSTILESTADGIIVLDETYKIIRCNKSALEIFNLTFEALQQMKLTDLIRNINIGKIILANDPLLHEAVAIKSDGSLIPVELVISKILLAHSPVFICSIRNIYQRKQLDVYFKMLSLITEVIAKNSSFIIAIPEILEIMGNVLDAEVGIFWKVDEVNNSLDLMKVWCKNKDDTRSFIKESQKIKFSFGNGLPGRAWEGKKPYVIADIATDTNFPRKIFASKSYLKSGLAFPIIFEDRVLGVIEFFMMHALPLDDSFKKLLTEVSNRIGNFIEKEHSQSKLLESQRKAGMAEVATSVLHNIGNVLNSVNVSASVLEKNIHTSKLSDLSLIKDLLLEDANPLRKALISDVKGQQLINYIIKLDEYRNKEKENNLKELSSLINNIQHVNTIIKSQQSFSVSISVSEPVLASTLVQEAFAINSFDVQHSNVSMEYEYQFDDLLIVDKIKVIQILINLIKNACQALNEVNVPTKIIHVKVFREDDHVHIAITDNGKGIHPDDMKKIFLYGFTTKKNGHGFGLHSSILSAKEMGGDLHVSSPGENFGATFTLVLPYKHDS